MARVIVAPFANSDLRDWPLPHYATLIAMLAARDDIHVELIGTAAQHAAASALVPPGAGGRVVNACGRHFWAECATLCRDADCVVGNNSGIAHLAGRLGAAVVCVFGAAHDRTEWGPVGPRVTLLSRDMACSPCHLPGASACPFGLACLADISPGEVAGLVFEALGDRTASKAISE